MNLRWLWFDHIPPELEVPKEAKAFVKHGRGAIWYEPFNRRSRWAILGITLPLLCIALTMSVLILNMPTTWAVPVMTKAAASMAPVAVPIVLAAWLQRRLEGRCWRLALCQLGYLCCVKCGYAHTGLSKDAKECPECGTPREFGKCIHCNAPQDWAMEKKDKCTQCGRMRLS